MTRKSKAKKKDDLAVSPEIPAISLPSPTTTIIIQNNDSTEQPDLNNQKQVTKTNNNKEQLKAKLFPNKTKQINNSSSITQQHDPVVTKSQNGDTFIIDSTNRNGSSNNGEDTGATIKPNFQDFQNALATLMQDRENPAHRYDHHDMTERVMTDSPKSPEPDDVRIDIEDASSGEVEEILGLDLEHENQKISPNSHQNFQLYFPGESSNGEHGSFISSVRRNTENLGLDAMTLCAVTDCRELAALKCKDCKNVFYCSDEHQKLDWKRHKDDCIPYRVRHFSGGDERGGGEPKSWMVAARNIPAGKDIFAEKPLLLFAVAGDDTDLVHVMDLSCVVNEDYVDTCGVKGPSCFGCLKSGQKRHRCPRCALPLCSPQCEYEISHQLGECSVIQECNQLTDEDRGSGCLHSLYMDVEILRALYLRQNDPADWERLTELRRHVRVETYKRSTRFALFRENMTRLVPLSAKVSGNDTDLISDLHAIITALSFRPALQSPYKMLIPTQLAFNHNCVPNTIHYVENPLTLGRPSKMRFVAKASVPIMKDEVISLDFLPTPYLSYNLRRKVLENLCLNCICERCKNPHAIGDHSGDIKCTCCHRGCVHAETALAWKDSVWSCDRCQEEVSYASIISVTKEFHSRLQNIPKSRIGLDKLKTYVHDAELRLNVNHELVIMAHCFIETIIRPSLEASRRESFPNAYKELSDAVLEDYRQLQKYCDACENHFKALRPGIWLDRGIVLFQKFFAHLALASHAFQHGRLSRKEYINKVIAYIKMLQEAIAIFAAYDGYNSTPAIQRLTADATWALLEAKKFTEKFLKEDSTTRRPVTYPLPI